MTKEMSDSEEWHDILHFSKARDEGLDDDHNVRLLLVGKGPFHHISAHPGVVYNDDLTDVLPPHSRVPCWQRRQLGSPQTPWMHLRRSCSPRN